MGVPWRISAVGRSLTASRGSKYRIHGEAVPVAVGSFRRVQVQVPNVGSWAEAPFVETGTAGTRLGSTYAWPFASPYEPRRPKLTPFATTPSSGPPATEKISFRRSAASLWPVDRCSHRRPCAAMGTRQTPPSTVWCR